MAKTGLGAVRFADSRIESLVLREVNNASQHVNLEHLVQDVVSKVSRSAGFFSKKHLMNPSIQHNNSLTPRKVR